MNFKQVITDILLNQNFIGAILTAIIFIVIGYILSNKKIINDKSKEIITIIVMNIALPAMAFKSFMCDLNTEELGSNLTIFILAIIGYIILLLLGSLIFIKKPKEKRKIYAIFMSLGQVTFFALPVMEAIYETNEALIPISLVIIIFRFFLYFYSFIVFSGISMNKENVKMSFKKILLNPIMIAMFIGIFIWLTQNFMFQINISSDETIKSYSILRIDKTLPALYIVLSYASNLVIPLSMLLIGFTLGKVNIIDSLRNKLAWFISGLRLIVSPLIIFIILILLGLIDNPIFHFDEYQISGMVIAFGAPLSAVVSTYAVQYEKEEALASSICFISCILSVITFPLFFILIKLYIN